MCLIISADSYWYSCIYNNLNNIILLGTENYPKTTTAAYYVLCSYKKPIPPHQVHGPSALVTFVQSHDTEKHKIVPGNDGISFTEVTCYRCQKTGNYAVNCPSSTSNTRTGPQSLQVVLTMTQKTKDLPTTNIINPSFILLDTWSTISSTRNKNLVQKSSPMMQEKNSWNTKMEDTKTMTTLQP